MAQDPLHVLWVEPRFPGRLGAVADWLVRRRGYRCSFYCHQVDSRDRWPESTGRGLEVVRFNVAGVARQPSVVWTRVLERSLCYAYGCWEVLNTRRLAPIDLIVGRSAGLGSTLFPPVYSPGAPVVNLFDYYYHAYHNDLADEADSSTPPAFFHWRRSANAIELLDLENIDSAWVPTHWQRSLFPAEYRDDFLVLNDGVDTRQFAPADRRGPRTIAGRAIPDGTKVVSFVAASPDRVRGVDRFLKLANALIRERTDVVCVIAGDLTSRRTLDRAFPAREDDAVAMSADSERLWRLGSVSTSVVADLLRASDLHVYPSRSYPIARSFLEALASGCTVLATDTEPVREIITSGTHGLLAEPDPDDCLRKALAVLDDPGAHRPLGEAGSELVRERYSRDVTIPRLAEHFGRLVEGRS